MEVIYDKDGEAMCIVTNPERRGQAITDFASRIGLGHKGAPSANGAQVSLTARR